MKVLKVKECNMMIQRTIEAKGYRIVWIKFGKEDVSIGIKPA